MKISKIHLTNFKRFTDLLIDNIPSTAKLVLLIGSNGSGKTSLFDAFGFIDSAIKRDIGTDETFWSYFRKKTDVSVSVSMKLDNTIC
jgi:AAA15 family ATPase/GTPase